MHENPALSVLGDHSGIDCSRADQFPRVLLARRHLPDCNHKAVWQGFCKPCRWKMHPIDEKDADRCTALNCQKKATALVSMFILGV